MTTPGAIDNAGGVATLLAIAESRQLDDRSIEFVAQYRRVSQGEGGYNEDHEYYGCKAEI